MAEGFCGKESRDDIISAGEMAICSLYGAHTGEGPDANKVSKNSTTVQLHSLPTTSAAASYHSARVYLQVQQWMGKGTMWTQNNGARYEYGITLSQE